MSEALTEGPIAAASANSVTAPWEDPPRGRATTSPMLAVDGFEGPLDWLVERARSRKIDLVRLSIVALVDAFVDAMGRAFGQEPGHSAPDLSRWAAWTVMTAQLTELRSRLLLPVDTPQARAAQGEAEALRQQLIRHEAVAAAADWLERRPQLGFEVFVRARPETFGAERVIVTSDVRAGEAESEEPWRDANEASPGLAEDLPVPGGDLTDLLRACLVALRLPAGAATYQPRRLPFWSVGEAAARIVRLLDGLPDGAGLGAFLPGIAGDGPNRTLRRRAALAATFVAGLELTRSGAVALRQGAAWEPIHVHRRAPRGGDDAATPRPGEPRPSPAC